MTDDDLRAIRERLEKARPGEDAWSGDDTGVYDDMDLKVCAMIVSRPGSGWDERAVAVARAAFFAAAVTDVPALLAEVGRLRAAVLAEREACAKVADDYAARIDAAYVPGVPIDQRDRYEETVMAEGGTARELARLIRARGTP